MKKNSAAQAARQFALAIALALFAAKSSPAVADVPLTLAEAQRQAVARSQMVVAQDFAVRASHEMAVAAAQFPDPVATLGINNLPVNGPDAWSVTRDFMTMRSVGVMQEITRTEKREARAERFDREAEKSLAGKPAIDAIRLDRRTLDEALAHHPQIAVLAKQEEIAAADVKVAQANKKPDWSVQLMYSVRGPAYSNMISVGVSVPLQWDQANRQDREVAAKLAMRDQARAEREDMLRAHTAEVRAMIVEWENDRERSGRYARELVPLASERTEATLGAYRGAKATLADLLVARRNEIDVRLQALQLELETARLWAQLNFLVPDSDTATHASVNQLKDWP